MIDPVRTSAVNPIAANVAGTDKVRRPTPQLVNIAKPQTAVRSASTSLPRLLELVADLANSGPPVDHVRIAQVRRAIADGSYKIDADALAKAIVSFAPEN